MDDLIMIRYYKLAYYNFVKQSKAKQSKANPVFQIFFPKIPYSLASSIAFWNLCTAIGYSALT